MAGMARVEVIGNLGRDGEVTYNDKGDPRIVFTVAHSPRVQQGQPERTAWYRCTLFGKPAESLSQYLVKGKQVFVRGDLDVREYKGNDGQTRTSLDIFVKEIELLGSRQDGEQQRDGRRTTADMDDDAEQPF